MAAARKPEAGVPVLLRLDPELLARLDRYWPEAGLPSRRAAIRRAIEIALAEHAACMQRQRHADSHGAWLAPARHTADVVADTWDRPLTRTLMDDRR